MTHSLQSRVVSRVALGLTVVLAGGAVSLYLVMRLALMAEFDAGLSLETRTLAAMVENVGGKLALDLDPAQLSRFFSGHHPDYFQLWSEVGLTIQRSPTLGEANLEFPKHAREHPTITDTLLPDQTRGRVAVIRFTPHIEGPDRQRVLAHPVTLAVTRRLDKVDSVLLKLAWALLGVSVGSIVAAVLLMTAMVRAGLRPLPQLAAFIESVGVTDLSERLSLEDAPRELRPVVQRLNELLERVQETLMREKAFTADVAHELRTPIASLRTTLEVCSSRKREPAAYHDVVTRCLAIADGMQAMVENLLLLARADARQLHNEPEPVDLPQFLQDCWERYEVRAAQRDVDLRWNIHDTGPHRLDREKLRIIINNLFDNAVSYVDEGGWISIEASITTPHSPTGPRLELRVSNSGSHVAAADVPHVFERFWRGDAARTETGLHCGVGLSLCSRIVEILGGEITVQSGNGVFTVTVACPLADAPAASPTRHPAN